MKELKALRPFLYNGKSYTAGQLFLADEKSAEYLVNRKLAMYVSIAPGTPVTTPIQAPVIEGENKMLKKETVRKPGRKAKK